MDAACRRGRLPQSRQRHYDPRLALCFYSQVPPLEQPLAPRPRQAPKGVRALSCLSAFATAFTTAERTSAGICATAASSRYAEASARCLSARSRRSELRRTTLLNESLMGLCDVDYVRFRPARQ